jgi:hypothetical protein
MSDQNPAAGLTRGVQAEYTSAQQALQLALGKSESRELEVRGAPTQQESTLNRDYVKALSESQSREHQLGQRVEELATCCEQLKAGLQESQQAHQELQQHVLFLMRSVRKPELAPHCLVNSAGSPVDFSQRDPSATVRSAGRRTNPPGFASLLDQAAMPMPRPESPLASASSESSVAMDSGFDMDMEVSQPSHPAPLPVTAYPPGVFSTKPRARPARQDLEETKKDKEAGLLWSFP